MNHTVFLCLGGNIGDRAYYIQSAIAEIDLEIGEVISQSTMYETEAWGVKNEQNYLNCCIKVNSVLPAIDLLDKVLQIEKKLGRVRKPQFQYGARTIDIDVLFYDKEVIETNKITVPHPRLHLRKFVLIPLNEIARDFIHPVLKEMICNLLIQCNDNLEVKPYVH